MIKSINKYCKETILVDIIRRNFFT